MSRGGEGDEYQEQMGVVKTEVPTKVHWAKRKCLKGLQISHSHGKLTRRQLTCNCFSYI